jgi:antitoxin VapB
MSLQGKESGILVKKMASRKINRVSLNIKNPEVRAAAARLAKLRGTTITGAVLGALKSELQRQERAGDVLGEVARMEEFSRRISALPILDRRSEDEILGYGEHGYPDGD